MSWQEIIAPGPICLSSGPAIGVMYTSSPCSEWGCLGGIVPRSLLLSRLLLWLLFFGGGHGQCDEMPCNGKWLQYCLLSLFFVHAQIQGNNNLIKSFCLLRKPHFLSNHWGDWLEGVWLLSEFRKWCLGDWNAFSSLASCCMEMQQFHFHVAALISVFWTESEQCSTPFTGCN